MGEKREKTPKDGGFGFRLAFAVFMTAGFAAMFIYGVILTVIALAERYESYKEDIFIGGMFGVIAAVFGIVAVLAYISAYKGTTRKWANVMIIAIGAPLCFGLVGIIPLLGGIFGIRDINNPQAAQLRRSKPKNGFSLRLVSPILFSLCFIAFMLVGIIAGIIAGEHYDTFTEWCYNNYSHIEFYSDRTAELIGHKVSENWSLYFYNKREDPEITEITVCLRGSGSLDYYKLVEDNKETKSATFINESGEQINLYYGRTYEYKTFVECKGYLEDYIYGFVLTFYILGAVFAVIAALQYLGAFAGKKHKWGNMLSIVTGAVTSPALLGIFALVGGVMGYKYSPPTEPEEQPDMPEQSTAAATNANAVGGAEDMQGIPLNIISIPDKEWKEYLGKASQDELLTLAVGMKLWLNKTRKRTLLYSLGMFLSVAIGGLIAVFSGVAGIIIAAVGYIVFATLCMRRYFITSSFSKTKVKLSAENKKALDTTFKTSGGGKVAEVFITLILCSLGEPYALALALISAVLPSVLNTKLVVPEGYGFEALEEVKGYFAEKSFLSTVVECYVDYEQNNFHRQDADSNAPSPTDEYYATDEYTYTDSQGYEQTVYTEHDSNEVRDAGGHYVGTIGEDIEEDK